MSVTMIMARALCKGFSQNGETNLVLRDVSVEFSNGRFTTIVGPNGCGKTTLLNTVAGLVSPDSGSVHIVTDHEGPARIGYVWQDYRASLLPWLSVADNISFPLKIHGASRRERHKAALEALSVFASDIRPDDPVYSLSGGQQQLVCLLRSYISNPDVLLLDEPLSALDQFTRWTMAFRIEEFWLRNRTPAIFVSHDVDEAVMLADEVLLMSQEDGRIMRTIENPLPRPRNKRMLTSKEHIQCREEVIDFLFTQGAIRDHNGNDKFRGDLL